MKNYLLLALFFSLVGCDYCSKKSKDKIPTVTVHGDISDSIKAKVPYVSNTNAKFVRSTGDIVNYSVERVSEVVMTDCQWCCEEIHTVEYEVETVKLTSDYPTFDIIFRMNNKDGEVKGASIEVSSIYFFLPFDLTPEGSIITHDSISVQGKTYFNVIELDGSNSDSATSEPTTLYYDKSVGIIKIFMDNDEYYEIQE